MKFMRRFDQNYIQFKQKGAGVTLYFSPELMRKNQKRNQVNDPWYIPAVPTGKPEFGAPNCPVRALRYYHRYLTEHPELRMTDTVFLFQSRTIMPVRSLVHPPFLGGSARTFLDLLKLTKYERWQHRYSFLIR